MNIQDFKDENVELELLDRWILSKLQKLIEDVTKAYESFQFNIALDSIRNFTWHVFCDQYIESIKYRLYSKEEKKSRMAAQYSLYHTTLNIIKLLASICPHLTESIHHLIVKDAEAESIHKTKWPSVRQELIDEEAEREGELIQALISELRKTKSEKRISLKKVLQEVIVYAKEEFAGVIERNSEVVRNTCHVEQLNIHPTSELDRGRALQNFPEIRILVKD